jgi:hypothetical protein
MRVMRVASDAELRSAKVVQRLAGLLVDLKRSRREIPNWLSEQLYDRAIYPQWPDGSPFPLPDIDEVFGDDASWRWLGCAMKFAVEPPRQLPQSRTLDRWRIIDLAFRAANDNEPI